MRIRTIVIALVLAATGTVLPTTAQAYRSNNSSWTDNDYSAWAGVSGGYVKGVSNNKLRGTGGLAYCNYMTWSGSTSVSAPGSTDTTLSDYWSVSAPGSVSVSVPAGVSVGGGGSSASWQTTVSGGSQSHIYTTYPINFKTSTWFYSINHSVSTSRRVGSNSYTGPSFKRYELVC